jgi:hypothetical protein
LIWSFLICITIALPLFAQEKNQKSHQQIESVKIAFITQKLSLNTTEAEKFWPLYNSYQSEMRAIYKLRRDARQKQKDNPDNKAGGELDFEGRLLDTRKKYKQEFTKVLSAEKVSSFFQAEREFREQMIKELKERREQ